MIGEKVEAVQRSWRIEGSGNLEKWKKAFGVLWILEVRKRKEKLLKVTNIPFIVPHVIKLNGSD